MNIVFIIAALVLGILSIGIFRNKQIKNPQENTFSILIACRDEEKNLPFLFRSLEKLNYPEDKFEIILADDASSDNSLPLIKEFCSKNKNAKYVHLLEKDTEYKGKKAALKKGLPEESEQAELVAFETEVLYERIEELETELRRYKHMFKRIEHALNKEDVRVIIQNILKPQNLKCIIEVVD